MVFITLLPRHHYVYAFFENGTGHFYGQPLVSSDKNSMGKLFLRLHGSLIEYGDYAVYRSRFGICHDDDFHLYGIYFCPKAFPRQKYSLLSDHFTHAGARSRISDAAIPHHRKNGAVGKLVVADSSLCRGKSDRFRISFPYVYGAAANDIYEAAEIDGAGDFRMYFSLSLPLTFGIIMVQVISIFSAIYNDYLWPLMMFMNNPEHGTLMPALKELAVRASETILPSGLKAGRGATYALYLVSGIPLIFSTVIGLKFFIDGEFASGMKL